MNVARAHVTVIVVSWNGRRHLARCLPALASQTVRDAAVVVVDNGSHDATVPWLRDAWPDVRVIALDENIGFAAANNRAVESTDGTWVALLNNDTVPEPDWLAALLSAAADRPRLAGVASLMVFESAPGIINSAGIAVDPTGIAWDRLGGAPESSGTAPAKVFGASAGAGLFLREALLDVAETGAAGRRHVFDERFFMFLEDVDLAWRLRLRGWDSTYEPRARVRHRGSASAGEGSAFKNRLLARNKIWTIVKDYPTGGLLPRLPIVLAYDLASAPYRLAIQGQTAAFLGRLEALRHLAPALRQRRTVQAGRSASWPEIRAAMAPVEAPWAVPRRYRHLHGVGPGGAAPRS